VYEAFFVKIVCRVYFDKYEVVQKKKFLEEYRDMRCESRDNPLPGNGFPWKAGKIIC
jgi:hypothetical protein